MQKPQALTSRRMQAFPTKQNKALLGSVQRSQPSHTPTHSAPSPSTLHTHKLSEHLRLLFTPSDTDFQVDDRMATATVSHSGT